MAQSKPCPLREDIDKEHLLDFLLRYATTQTSVGVQTNRIVVNTTRIAHAYGYEPTIMTFQRNMTMTLTPVLGDGKHSYRPLDPHPVSGMLQHQHPADESLAGALSHQPGEYGILPALRR